jgi:hypothetical protein
MINSSIATVPSSTVDQYELTIIEQPQIRLAESDKVLRLGLQQVSCFLPGTAVISAQSAYDIIPFLVLFAAMVG